MPNINLEFRNYLFNNLSKLLNPKTAMKIEISIIKRYNPLFKNYIILTTFLAIKLINGQTLFSNYYKGYKRGFEDAYCYNIPVLSICNPPSINYAPEPLLNENIDNYSDGYRRGFSDGTKNGINQQLNLEIFNNQYLNNPKPNLPLIKPFRPNFNLLFYAINFQNIQLERTIIKNDDSEILKKFQETLKDLEHQKIVHGELAKLMLMNNQNIKFFPAKLKDGSYKVNVVSFENNTPVLQNLASEDAYAIVFNNRIEAMLITNLLGDYRMYASRTSSAYDNCHYSILNSSEIDNGISLIVYSSGPKLLKTANYFGLTDFESEESVYFTDYTNHYDITQKYKSMIINQLHKKKDLQKYLKDGTYIGFIWNENDYAGNCQVQIKENIIVKINFLNFVNVNEQVLKSYNIQNSETVFNQRTRIQLEFFIYDDFLKTQVRHFEKFNIFIF
jgi:hypothetical protein